MIHWAKINENNIVEMVVVAEVSENDTDGLIWCQETFGGQWIRTSIDGSINKNYAGTGYLYREDLSGFIPPKEYESWILNEDTCNWHAPVEKPEGIGYSWDENTLSWNQYTV